MRGVASLVNRVLGAVGLKIMRVSRATQTGPHSALFRNRAVTDLDELVARARSIPGMLSEESGRLLYGLCYAQQLEGDVVEVGSWQGYSTSFLARAVADSGKGRMYAIDHFRGNVGKERLYVIDRPDLSDLRRKFEDNMRRLGLDETVRLLPMPNHEAADQLRREAARIRFLFIDGDHSKEGVQRDVDLFFPFLMSGSIVVFDDCSPSAPGIIEVVDELFRKKVIDKAFVHSNALLAIVGAGGA
jgi:predicted O-methyltransferase YrrM